MQSPHVIVVLGADRVGKSTAIKNTAETLRAGGNNVQTLHFSGPKPTHNSPIDQYILPFDTVQAFSPDFVICDRGFSEVTFYAQWRRHIAISEEWAMSAESYFMSKSSKIDVFLIERPWEWCESHHIEEIIEEFGKAISPYFIRNQLMARKAEHEAYYKYMNDYLDNRSLIQHRRLYLTGSDPVDLTGFLN